MTEDDKKAEKYRKEAKTGGTDAPAPAEVLQEIADKKAAAKAADVPDVPTLAGKRKLEQEQELEPDQVMTTEEAVMLSLAASQYYTNQNTDGDYDDLAQSGTFGLNVYKKARDVLKPKYKELFDVKAIAKKFKKLADNAWD